ncbi:MAG: hypothetical protein WBJ35_05575 [Acetomicrobium sp.]|jgi:hypothetical protein
MKNCFGSSKPWATMQSRTTKKLDKIADALFNLEEVKNVRSFVELLRKD